MSTCSTLSLGYKPVAFQISLDLPRGMSPHLGPVPSPPAGELEIILSEIERALDAGFYYLAVMVALTLPDICGALESPDGRAHRSRYKDWFRQNLSSLGWFLTEDDCYSLRCGVLHQGRSEVVGKGASATRVLFKLPDPYHGSVHNCGGEDVLQYEADTFCDEIIEAVRSWYHRTKANPDFVKNVQNLVRLRPNGFAPFISGVAVIA
jgi:hypothetical protein